MHIGLDSRDLFWPKIVIVGGIDQIAVNIQFLQRLYAIYPYFSSLSGSLDGIVILQDEQTTMRVIEAYTRKSYMVIETQSFMNHTTATMCPIWKIGISLTLEMAKRMYKLKNKIFDNIYRKLILTRPRIVREIKMIMKNVVNNIDNDKLTMPKNKINECMICFHKIINTEYMEKCLDFASRIIFVKNSPRIKVLIFCKR